MINVCRFRFFAITLLCLAAVGCEDSASTATARLRAHADCLVKKHFHDVSYDVQKTDSLVSPYMGFLTYFQSITENIRSETKIILAYQEGRWIVKGVEFRIWDSGKPFEWQDELENIELHEGKSREKYIQEISEQIACQ